MGYILKWMAIPWDQKCQKLRCKILNKKSIVTYYSPKAIPVKKNTLSLYNVNVKSTKTITETKSMTITKSKYKYNFPWKWLTIVKDEKSIRLTKFFSELILFKKPRWNCLIQITILHIFLKVHHEMFQPHQISVHINHTERTKKLGQNRCRINWFSKIVQFDGNFLIAN